MSTINISLAFGAVGLVLALLAILTKRRLYRRFPAFFAYCLWTLVVAILRFFVREHPIPYFVVYWITEASYFVLAFAVMLSLFQPFTEVTYRQQPWSRHVMLSVCVLVIGISLWAVFFKSIAPTTLARFASGMYMFVPLICLFEVVLFILAVFLKRQYSFEWTRYEAGILAGFGILAFMTMLARLPGLLALFHFKAGPQLEALFRYFPSGAFISSALAWLIAFWRPEPPTTLEPPPSSHKYRELARVMRESLAILKEIAKRLGFDMAAVVEDP